MKGQPSNVQVRDREGKKWVLICSANEGPWFCPAYRTNYHNYNSLSQHLRRVHSLVSFVFCCWHCRVLFGTKQALNAHSKLCRGRMTGGSHGCTICGARYERSQSLEIHSKLCFRDEVHLNSNRVESDERSATEGLSCKYCGKAWPINASLAQHVRNKHMAESQVDRVKELTKPPSRAGAANWKRDKSFSVLLTSTAGMIM